MEEQKQQVHDIIQDVFTTLGITGEFHIIGDTLDEGSVLEVSLDTEDTSLVIGYHGETLEALQLILSLACYQKLDRFVHISLEVGDYKKNREEFLKNLAERTKERVLMEGQEIPLSDLKAWERRYVHMLLQEDGEVVTESTGEGKERTLIVKPK